MVTALFLLKSRSTGLSKSLPEVLFFVCSAVRRKTRGSPRAPLLRHAARHTYRAELNTQDV
eukprot:3943661-Pyramimonas_sp.AAC.1